MGTLSSELGSFAEGLTDAPRVYCDANLPSGLIRFMRERLGWDVLFVLEEAQLRRAADIEHFRLASQLRRTLLTLDRDYLDDIRFPPVATCGVLVLSAPDEQQFQRLLKQVDRVLFRSTPPQLASERPEIVERGRPSDKRSGANVSRTPLFGRKLLVHTDWQGEMA